MIPSPDTKQRTANVVETDQYVVAIGASAGGLEAIQEFFDNMPSNGNLSFIIIQHLSPDYKSLLVEILGKHTHMKVQEAAHNARVEKNCVYVIPNDKLLTIRGGLLQLTEKKAEKAPNTAIDTFLRSLAEDQGAKAIAVVLSGTGTDGSKGIEVIQAAGGMVLVQDPITAKFDGMPNSAIASGYADYILSPELMPEEIFNYIKERPIRIAGDGKPDETYLPEILKLVEKSCQYDFTNYKTPTILRRIGRRMTQLGYKKFSEYLNFLRTSGEECKLLGKEFLIGVTKFFRDRAAFDILRDEVMKEM
ncbi:MAG TPA: chemotaxis protein CheB, partial [Flavisolibacter sp.]|nr:chemotaxis protein CheB [Flavisolibacter sp.]